MKIGNHAWFRYAPDLHIELRQAEDEGKNVEGLERRIASIVALGERDPERERMATELLDDTERLPVRDGYAYDEPSDLDGIRRSRPAARNAPRPYASDKATVYDKVYGAWLGRCAGCLLGQPVEGWKRERLTGLLRDTDNYPISYYLSSEQPQSIIDRYGLTNEGQVYGSSHINWINNVRHMVEDDDTNYTIVGLAVLERYGYDFTPDDVAESWLMNLPILHVCTAERVAYRNLVNLVEPPRSASFRNVYREWIGAQIRADMFGYANPGHPEKAAEMAWRDAAISHVKNGIFGEMWVAAMLASAAVQTDIEQIVLDGLNEIPERSRLAEAVKLVIGWRREGISWEEGIVRIHGRYDESSSHHWCHAISNAMIVALALLFGEGDLERTIGIAVAAAFDTDCNGATAGSIVGMLRGAAALPEKWTAPLNDLIKSGVDGFGLVRISELAERTAAVIEHNPYLRR
ncbi:ADP-ribosylglycohydrolase family protein [Cohnella nanjingensis]|uniref:ADP-ribosylglycohydrolase family protein n=1 Tax=Cohnella nanjingensis TaxID=1387779 RepID=A0A7X0RTU4_9BACL|nr:ADP-ribosylglycohydrolase family protein [Cohnella nanjingensis]MBB6673475.1 ADP-ribosylglycohydrolase family protein [Cohnella nanjingensis]